MKSLIAIAALGAAVALAAPVAAARAAAAAPAAAPAAKSAKQPIDITSDQSETRTADCTTIFTGSPEALQDTSRLRADTMIGHQEVLKKTKAPKAGQSDAVAGTCGDTVSLEARGNVYYAAPDGRRVHGDDAVYVYANTTLTVTGDVTVVDGQNVMRGSKMVYNTKTGEGHMEGGGKGPGAKNRTRGVFYPKDAAPDASANGTAADATTSDATAAKPKKKAAK